MPSIETIPQDIYNLLVEGKRIPAEDIDKLSHNISQVIKKRLKETSSNYRSPPKSVYRMGNLGKGNRFLWYSYRDPERFTMKGSRLKLIMLYGDIIEEIFLFLIKASGHKVEGEQDLVTLNGARGKRDAKIDGVNADIKSMSPFVFAKFTSKDYLKTKEYDPYGYKAQVSSYAQADSKKPFKDHDYPAALLGMDKSSGGLHVLKIEAIDQEDMSKRVDEIKSVVESDKLPLRCFSDVAEGKKGNRRLHANCVFCKYRSKGPEGTPGCWDDSNNGEGLRVFQYKGGIRKYFTNLEVEPKATEITQEKTI